MELDVFAGQEKSELSMIEVARAILETRGRDNEMYFNDLVNEIQNYLAILLFRFEYGWKFHSTR